MCEGLHKTSLSRLSSKTPWCAKDQPNNTSTKRIQELAVEGHQSTNLSISSARGAVDADVRHVPEGLPLHLVQHNAVVREHQQLRIAGLQQLLHT
jgi:hypothetical protein